jgi:hypothetical protein
LPDAETQPSEISQQSGEPSGEQKEHGLAQDQSEQNELDDTLAMPAIKAAKQSRLTTKTEEAPADAAQPQTEPGEPALNSAPAAITQDEETSSPSEQVVQDEEAQLPSEQVVQDEKAQLSPVSVAQDEEQQLPSAATPQDEDTSSPSGQIAQDEDTQLSPAQDEETLHAPAPVAQDEETQFSPASVTQDTDREPQFSSMTQPDKQRRGRQGVVLLITILVVLIVLAGGAGAFALLRQHTPTGAAAQCSGQQAGCATTTPGVSNANATRLIFSGKVSGPMTVNASARCQSATTNSLRTLTVTLSGTIGTQFYNFGFAIDNYHGVGTYSDAAPALTILLDAPGDSTNNGWGNTASTDTGNITVERGERSGSISYLLSGFGTQAGTQVQISGNWTCG